MRGDDRRSRSFLVPYDMRKVVDEPHHDPGLDRIIRPMVISITWIETIPLFIGLGSPPPL